MTNTLLTHESLGTIDDVPYELYIDETSDRLWELLLNISGIIDLLNGKKLTVEQLEELNSDPNAFKLNITADECMSHAIDAYINVRNSYESLDRLIILKNKMEISNEL